MIAWNKFSGYSPDGRRTLYKGGGGSSTTTVQSIPNELKPLASAYTAQAMNLSNQPYTPYTQQRYADLNGTQNYGIGMVQDRAVNGSDTMDNAETNLNSMMDGGSNPYLDESVNKALGNVQSRVNSQFNNNNYGTTAHQETLATALGDTANDMYSGNYQADQSRRLSAINSAPTFGNQAYTDASQLLNAGQLQQNQQQNNMDFNYQQFQDQQNLPYKNLAAMAGVFNSNLGGTSTSQSSGGGK